MTNYDQASTMQRILHSYGIGKGEGSEHILHVDDKADRAQDLITDACHYLRFNCKLDTHDIMARLETAFRNFEAEIADKDLNTELDETDSILQQALNTVANAGNA